MPIIQLVAIVVVAVGVGGLIAWAAPDNQALLIGSIVGVLLVALLTKAIFGRLDPFEPLVPFSVMWIVMFVGRPLAMLHSNYMSLRYKYDATPAFSDVLWLALAGCSAFVIGYGFSRSSFRRKLLLSSKSSNVEQSITGSVSRLASPQAFIVIGIFGALAFFVIAKSYGSKVGGSSAYLYFAPLLATPVALLLLSLRTGHRLLLRVLALLIVAIVVSSYWTAGERFFGLLPLAAVAVYYYLARRTRPRLIYVLVIIVLLPSLLLLVESQRARTSSSKGFFLDPTTEMFPALAVEIETRNTVWSETPGYLAYSGLVHWVPSQLWPNKPKTYQEALYSKLFPENYSVAKNGTEFSVLGDFYYDSGFMGVIVGMFVLGWFLRQIYERWVLHPRTDLGAVAYAPVPALTVIMLRGDLVLFAGLALYVYLPILAAKMYAVRRERHIQPNIDMLEVRSGPVWVR